MEAMSSLFCYFINRLTIESDQLANRFNTHQKDLSRGFDSSEVGLRAQLSQIGAPIAVTISYKLFKRFSGKFNQKLENLAEETGQDFLADSMAS